MAATPSDALVPALENDYEYLYGGEFDPGVDEHVLLIHEPDTQFPEDATLQRRNLLENLGAAEADPAEVIVSSRQLPDTRKAEESSTNAYLTSLPSELIDLVLSFLGPVDLTSISSTCSLLFHHSRSDASWQRHVQDNIPGVTLTSPSPCSSYRELYIAHDPHWFLPKYKLWFCDYFLTGKLILVRYDPRRGCIEGYRLVCQKPPPKFEPWEYDDEVVIHSFEPECRLHLDQPVLQLDALSLESLMRSSPQTKLSHRFNAETPMRNGHSHPNGVFSNFILTRPVEERPNMQLWPPPTIPARHRIRNASQESYVGSGHKPQKRSEVSTQSFRIRRWMEMLGPQGSTPGVHLGEEVFTYATLDPKLYTPTEEKPYRGIWVGDYSGHGCEFILMHQPDDEEPFDEASVIQAEDETVEEFQIRRKEERIYRGSIEAIKLTGDPNVPRGEYSFITDDLSDKSFVRTATEERFKGARIVRSRGHIATRMFRNDKYVESQMILISHNRIAQYWVKFGHISFFERVNIDEFLSPFNDPRFKANC